MPENLGLCKQSYDKLTLHIFQDLSFLQFFFREWISQLVYKRTLIPKGLTILKPTEITNYNIIICLK